MSFDLAVWKQDNIISDEVAGEIYINICEGNKTNLTPDSNIDNLYSELVNLHPEINDVPEDRIDDHDYSPWSCQLDKSDSYIVLSCVLSKSEYVYDLLAKMTNKHSLALYDPQSSNIIYPEPNKKWYKFWK